MNIAILTYGEFRTAEVAIKTWNILKNHNVDCYVHTLDTSYDTCKSEDTFRVIEKYDISELLPNAKVWIETRDNFRVDNVSRDIHMNFRSFRFLYEKIKESNKKYDFIIVNRLDTLCYIHDLDNFLNNFDSNKVYVLNNEITLENSFLQDHFIMGGYNIIMNVLQNLPNSKDLIKSHEDFGKYLLKNFKLGFTDILCFHLRKKQVEIVSEAIKNNMLEYYFIRKDDGKFMNKISEIESLIHLEKNR